MNKTYRILFGSGSDHRNTRHLECQATGQTELDVAQYLASIGTVIQHGDTIRIEEEGYDERMEREYAAEERARQEEEEIEDTPSHSDTEAELRAGEFAKDVIP